MRSVTVSGSPRGRLKKACLSSLVILLLAMLPTWPDPVLAQDPSPIDPARPCVPHPPIRIEGDHGPTGFTDDGLLPYRLGSGVSAGSGTSSDPFVIEGWCIAVPAGETGIGLVATSAHVILRDNTLFRLPGLGGERIGVHLSTAENATVEGNRVHGLSYGTRVSDSPLTLLQDNRILDSAHTAIDVEGSSEVVLVDNLVSASAAHAVRIRSSDAAHVEGNVLEWSGREAVTIAGGRGHQILRNQINESEVGIQLDDTEKTNVSGNRIFDGPHWGSGIYLKSADGTGVAENVVRRHWFGLRGHFAENSDVFENLLAFNGIGASFGYGGGNSLSNNTILNSGGEGLRMEGGKSDSVRGNNISQNGANGIIVDSAHISIEDNIVHGNGKNGILTVVSQGVTVRGNDAKGNGYNGFLLSFTLDAVVDQNDARENTYAGLAGVQADGSTLTNNTLVGNGRDGIYLAEADRTLVQGNQIDRNGWNGVASIWAGGNTLTGNTITNNTRRGFHMDHPGMDASLPPVRVEQNTFSGNMWEGVYIERVSSTVHLRDNWWGATSGPSGGVTDACSGTVADGEGDAVRAAGVDVCFDPWLPAAPTG